MPGWVGCAFGKVFGLTNDEEQQSQSWLQWYKLLVIGGIHIVVAPIKVACASFFLLVIMGILNIKIPEIDVILDEI